MSRIRRTVAHDRNFDRSMVAATETDAAQLAQPRGGDRRLPQKGRDRLEGPHRSALCAPPRSRRRQPAREIRSGAGARHARHLLAERGGRASGRCGRGQDFSSSARNLSFLTRETGLTINQLRTLEALAPRIGTSVEAMDEALRGFGEHMEKLRRSPLSVLRESFAALSVRPDPAVISSWRNLIGSLEGLPRSEQLGKIVGYLDRIRDMGQKRAVLGAFGLPPELSRLSGRELQEAIDRIRKIQRDLSPEEVAGGKAAAESIEDISLALKNLRDRVGAGLAPDLAKIAESHRRLREPSQRRNRRRPPRSRDVGQVCGLGRGRSRSARLRQRSE